MNMLIGTIFQLVVAVVGSSLISLLALLYFRRVRLERPPIGVFNTRDIVLMVTFIVLLPFLYLILPTWLLVGLLCLTFSSAMYITLRPFLRPLYLWGLIVVLLAGDILVAELLLGTRPGWMFYWAMNDIVVLTAIVGISNLYVQGGMRLRQIAWLTLLLAVYDFTFSIIIPLSVQLADRLEGQPLDAALGWVMGPYTANVGIGDLLMFTLFMVGAYKGFGRKGFFAALAIIAIFGAALPSLSPLVISSFVRTNIGIVIPIEAFFGPAAFVTYYLLQRSQPERSMGQWLSVQAAEGHEPIHVVRRPRRTAVPAARPVAVPLSAETNLGQGD